MAGVILKILIVGEDSAYCHKLEGMLAAASVGTVEVQCAADFDAAMELLSASHFDVCLLNFQLGTHAGIDVLARVNPLFIRTAFILLANSARKDWCYSALQHGAMDYVVKDDLTEFGLMKSVSFSLFRKSREIELQAIALRDSLTGMGNRTLFAEQADTLIRLSQRTREKIGVLFMDIDGMKPVNDCHGHEVGDAVLKIAAQRMTERLRKGDIVSRWGGDEFAALLVGVDSIRRVNQVADTLSQAVAQPYILKDCTVHIDLSCGTALYPDDSQDINELVRIADLRMYENKMNKKKAATSRPEMSWLKGQA